MTQKEEVLALLRETEEPLCDACIRRAASVESHQAVNQIARQMAEVGLTTREPALCSGCGKQAKCNTAAGVEPLDASSTSPVPVSTTAAGTPSTHLWYWEGNVQAAVVEWLKQQGWEIVQAVDTAAKTPGVDIIARRPPEKELWVTVKGFPQKSKYVQARHWFAGAIFDLVTYRDKNADLYLAVALPDGYKTYWGLAAKTGWLKKTLPFTILWVREGGEVRSE